MSQNVDIVGTLERVGRRLQVECDPEPIPAAKLIEAVVQECGCRSNSVIPSDYCYNRTNDGIPSNNPRIFIHEERGMYRFVGGNYPYTGPMYHNPKGKDEPERVVGQWSNGKLQMME